MSFKRGCEIPESIPYGEALWPEKQTLEQLKVIEQGDPYTFESQYQQRPSPLGGGMFKTEWFKYYEVLPTDIMLIRIYGDTAQKTAQHNDYSVFQCWGKSPSMGIFLLDQCRGKWEAPELEAQLVAFWNKHKPNQYKPLGAQCVKIEDKSSGSSLIQSIKKENLIPIEGIQRGKKDGKLERAMAVVKYFSMGYIHLPKDAEWLFDFKQEFASFTPKMTHKHDDQIDPTMDAVKDLLVDDTILYNSSWL